MGGGGIEQIVLHRKIPKMKPVITATSRVNEIMTPIFYCGFCSGENHNKSHIRTLAVVQNTERVV